MLEDAYSKEERSAAAVMAASGFAPTALLAIVALTMLGVLPHCLALPG